MNPFTPHPTKEPIRRRISNGAYHAENEIRRGDPAFTMSQSQLVKFIASPSKWIRGTPDDEDETSAMRWGSLVDQLLTDSEGFAARYAVTPMHYESEGMKCPKCGSVTDSASCKKCKCERIKTPVEKEWTWLSDTCQEWREKQWSEGKEVIEHSRLEAARLAVARLHEDSIIRDVLSVCETQIVCNAQYEDSATGLVIPIKAMIDFVPGKESIWGNYLGDLKCPNDASPRKWSRWVNDQMCHLQAAFYLDVFNVCAQEHRQCFFHILSEQKRPYEPGRRQLSQEWLDFGRGQYMNALQFYCRCLSRNEWPGFDDLDDDGTLGPIVEGFRVTEIEAWMMK